MNRGKFSYALIFCGCFFLAPSSDAKQPNFIFILADDMPWYGTSVQMEEGFKASAGQTRRTPVIDQLARDGMTFSRAFAPAGMCAPSRCSIQTGMSAARTRFSGNGNFDAKTREVIYGGRRSKGKLVLEPQPIGSLDPDQDTIAEYLKPLGYASAHIGKWHIYGGGPGKHGYDVHDGPTTNNEGNSEDPEDPKLIFSITRKAISFMETQAKADQPFYLQVSHYAEHNAVQCLPETAAQCLKLKGIRDITSNALRKRVAQRTAMVLDMDRSIGMLFERLDQLGLSENTYVVFMSDNGHHRDTGSKKFLRGNKWWLWEGGVRVPMIVRGPGIKGDSRCDVNVVGYDFLPTFVDLAGGSLNKLRDIDGVSISSLLKGQEDRKLRARFIYFHYPHHRNTSPHSVVLQGDLKYFRFYEQPDSQYLYNLKYAIGETENIALQNKSAVARLSREMDRYHLAVKACLPKPNTDADSSYKPFDPDKTWE